MIISTCLMLLLGLVQPAPPVSRKVMYPATVHKVHDGDTIQVTIKFPWGISLGPEWVRTSSYDAWEITKTRRTVVITDEELVKGREAKAAIEDLFAGGKVYVAPVEPEGSRDVYGRILADFYLVPGSGKVIDVAAWMKKNGHDRGGVK